jgi:hypothetical protein
MGSSAAADEPVSVPNCYCFLSLLLPRTKVRLTLADLPLRGDPTMSISVQSIHPVNTQAGTQLAAQAPKETTTQPQTPQDKVTISSQAQQALVPKPDPGA